MNIEKELKQLMLKNECVIVPGFGAFITHYEGAQIYPGQNQFLPPSKTVSFNRLLSSSDGLLLSAISLSNNVSYSDAKLFVEKQVNQWNLSLEKQETIIIKEIGKLQKTKDDKIDFISGLTENLSLASYGLNRMYHHPVERIFTRTVANEGVNSINKPSIKKQKDQRRKNTRRKSSTSSYILLACLVSIIALSQLLIFTEAPIKVKEANFINFLSSENTIKHVTAHKRTEHYLPSTIINDSIGFRTLNQKCPVKAKVIEESIALEAPIPVIDVNITPVLHQNEELPLGYYVILGCFKEAKNAEKLKSLLINKGEKVYKKTSNTGFTTVGEFLSTSKEEANKELKIRQQTQADVWLKKI